MTNERAIELLNRISDSQFDGVHGDERREALEMAVRVLSGDGDTISRQQAIDATRNATFSFTIKSDIDFANYRKEIQEIFNNVIDAQEKALNELPSVQPEILACGNGELVQESDDLVHDLVKDCISRQQAIEAFEPEHDTDWYTPQIIEVLEALPPVQPTQTNADSTQSNTLDCVSRRAAIDALDKHIDTFDAIDTNYLCGLRTAMSILKEMPSAQPERDIPVKPIETTDKAWGIPARQAVCPKCDYYLGHVAFLGDYKGKRVTYCETCGQAIDWEGWNFDE